MNLARVGATVTTGSSSDGAIFNAIDDVWYVKLNAEDGNAEVEMRKMNAE